MRRSFLTLPDGQIHYREAGSGPPLVLLHQTASSSEMYLESAPCLARSARVIALDTPGFGGSFKPDGPPAMRQYAGWVIGCLDALGLDQVRLLGHHTGASIALEVAAARPDRVSRLILCGLPDYDPAGRAAKMSAITDLSYTTTGDYLDTAWQRVGKNRRSYLDTAMIARTTIAQLEAGPRYSDAYHAVYTYDPASRAPHVTAPTLLLASHTDEYAGRQDSLAAHFRDARTRILDCPGAITMQAIPDQFCQAVVAFLAA